MKENKDIHPVDKLFRQSLEGYSPPPPPSVWKSIRAKKPNLNPSAGKWLIGSAGFSVLAVAVMMAAAWFLYKSHVSGPSKILQHIAVPAIMNDSAAAENPAAKTIPLPEGRHTDTTASPSKAAESRNYSYHSAITPALISGKTAMQKPEKVTEIETNEPNIKKNEPNILTSTTSVKTDLILPEVPIGVADSGSNKKNVLTFDKGSGKKPVLAVDSNELNNALPSGKTFFETTPQKPDGITQAGSLKEEKANGIHPAPSSSPASLPENGNAGKTNSLPGRTLANVTEAENKQQPSGMAEPNIPTGHKKLTQNLLWQAGISGNAGQVYQKQRNSNLAWGGMITGGIWNTKLNAGVETGLMLIAYKDYGSVENNSMLTEITYKQDTTWSMQDSVPVITTDTIIRHTAFKDTLLYKYNYTYLQIPFLITKQLASFGKFSLNMKAGAIAGFKLSKKESVTHTAPAGLGEIVSSTDKNYSRLNVSWQLYIAPELKWDLSGNWSAEVSPVAILFLNNLYEKKNRPANLPFSIQITAGFKYTFK